MKKRFGMMVLAAVAMFGFEAICAEPAKSAAKNNEVPDCCKPDFLNDPAGNAPVAKPVPREGGCGMKGGQTGGCGGHGAKAGGCGGHGAKGACEGSTITLVLPCGHDIKILVNDGKPAPKDACGMKGAKEGGCGGHGAKEGGCGMKGGKTGGCGGHGAKEGGCGMKGGKMGGCGGHGPKATDAPNAK